MNIKSLLFAAALASSPAAGNDVPNQQNKTSQQVHESLKSNEQDALHPHVEISTGFEYNHLLDHGQLMEGDFFSLGIHGSLEDGGAYYHWLQAQDSALEHKAGIMYSQRLHPGFVLRAGLSGVYEVAGSEHGTAHTQAHSESSSEHDGHQKKEPVHAKVEESEPALESTLYAAAALELEAVIAKNEHSTTTLTMGGEYDFGVLDTSFVHAGIEYTYDIGQIQLTTQAKVIHVLSTKSSHIEEGTLGVFGAGFKIPLTKHWSIDLGGQATTRGDTTGRAMATWTF